VAAAAVQEALVATEVHLRVLLEAVVQDWHLQFQALKFFTLAEVVVALKLVEALILQV
jgi:hypothetical protein